MADFESVIRGNHTPSATQVALTLPISLAAKLGRPNYTPSATQVRNAAVERTKVDPNTHKLSTYASALGLRLGIPCSASPLSSEHASYKTLKARFWPWLSGSSP